MKSIIFSNSYINDCEKSLCINLLGDESRLANEKNIIDLSAIYGFVDDTYLSKFSVWLGKLNIKNADIFWWAHTSTAKNMLSSPVGDRFLQVHAVCEIVRNTAAISINVVGASPGVMESIVMLLNDEGLSVKGMSWRFRWLRRTITNLTTFLRIIFQCLNLFFGNYFAKQKEREVNADVCLFTYIDSRQHEETDNYFGKLPEMYRDNDSDVSFAYLAYVSKPYRLRMKTRSQLRNTTPYVFLFGILAVYDYLWGMFFSLRELWVNTYKRNYPYTGDDDYRSLLREIFVHDLSYGGYFHNLLVNRAVRRFLDVNHSREILYPFENKSLEKMLVLAARSAKDCPKIIGYQHTSITPRHSTQFFVENEAGKTPLPDKIVTVGGVTKRYMEKHGNYPAGILVAGCALRQEWSSQKANKYRERKNVRILLALSSSKKELEKSIQYMKSVKILLPEIEIGIRPHPEFPLTLLSKEQLEWIEENAIDFSRTMLSDNIDWCHLTAYVSSTVALETLMRGKPVIKISIGDVISPDPVIGDVSFHWDAKDEADMVEILVYIKNMSDSEYIASSNDAIEYVADYLTPVSDRCLNELVC